MERKTSKPIFATRTIAMQVNVNSVCAFKPKFAHSVCVHFTETYSVQEIWFYPSWHSFCPQLFWLEISNLTIFRIKPLVEYLSLQENRVIWKYAILSEEEEKQQSIQEAAESIHDILCFYNVFILIESERYSIYIYIQ